MQNSPSDEMDASPSYGMKTSPSDGTNISSSSGGTQTSFSSGLLIFPNLDETDERSLMIHGYDTDDNWTWLERGENTWVVDPGARGYQEFYDMWRAKTTDSDFRHSFPYELSLGMDTLGAPLPPFRADYILGDKIVVTESYDQMYHRLLRLRMSDKGGKAKGAVLTGQPGVGKTTFLKFMLARLILARQVVVLCDNNSNYLFYAGKVYSRPTNGGGFENLPTNKKVRYFPVWALIDVDYENKGPNLGSRNVWPMQTCSPFPSQWKAWCKQNGAAVLGMPLWTSQELVKCLQLHMFNDTLEESLQLLDGPTCPTSSDEITNAILNILWTERKKTEVVVVAEEDHDEMDGVELATDQDAYMADEANKPQVSVGKAFEILVRNVTEEIGFAPRDVYNGVLYLPEMKRKHEAAVGKLGYYKLVTLIRTFSEDCLLDNFSHHVVAVHPHQISDREDSWQVHFKSTQIMKGVESLMWTQEDRHLRETYSHLRKIPEGSTLAGWIFKKIASNVFTEGWKGTTPQITRMVSGNPDSNSPVFSTDPSSPSSPLGLRIRTAQEVLFAPKRGIPVVTLNGDKFYIPSATNNPLFDFFTVYQDHIHHTVVISIYKITITKSHRGSAQGYPRIRKIAGHVDKLLEGARRNPKVEVEVKYYLVCPADEVERKWTMPSGWNTMIDHRGEFLCIRVPGLQPLDMELKDPVPGSGLDVRDQVLPES